MLPQRFAGRSYLKRPVDIQILPGFYVYLSVMLLLLPFPWLCASLIAGSLHELGHIAAVKAMGISISQITLQGGGARIRTGPMSPGQELLCAAAGPTAGGLLLLLLPVFPKLALCGLLQSLFNLIPVGLFDGARMIRSAAVLLLGEKKGERVFNFIKWFCIAATGIGCMILIRFSLFAAVFCVLCLLYCVIKMRTQHLTNLPGVIN